MSAPLLVWGDHGAQCSPMLMVLTLLAGTSMVCVRRPALSSAPQERSGSRTATPAPVTMMVWSSAPWQTVTPMTTGQQIGSCPHND